MNCKKFERLLSRSLDGFLKAGEREKLDEHIESCPSCRRMKEDYELIFDSLREKEFPEPQPYFWERLRPKLRERKKLEAWLFWKQLGLRAVPLSLLFAVLITTVLIFSFPEKNGQLSQSGVLLFQNQNPIQETKTILEEEKVEDKNMMLIFASLEEKNGSGRHQP